MYQQETLAIFWLATMQRLVNKKHTSETTQQLSLPLNRKIVRLERGKSPRIQGINVSLYCVQEMGIPLNNLICASNENNILTDFFHSGSYDMSKRRIQQTLSPSIDILKSSNLERLLYHVTGREVSGLMKSLDENKHFQVCD